MIRRIAVITLTLGTLLLAGCAQQYTPSGQSVNVSEVKLPDGRVVSCVVAGSGGVDCDWEGAR